MATRLGAAFDANMTISVLPPQKPERARAPIDGLALLREIRSRWPEVVVVLMTAYATVAQAVEAMR